MKIGLLIRVIFSFFFLGGCLYSYLDKQNEITQLQIKIPELSTEVRRIEEENMHFLYEIERFESPENLMKIANTAEFSHLQHPIGSAVVALKQAELIEKREEKMKPTIKAKPSIHFATGAKP